MNVLQHEMLGNKLKNTKHRVAF